MLSREPTIWYISGQQGSSLEEGDYRLDLGTEVDSPAGQ